MDDAAVRASDMPSVLRTTLRKIRGFDHTEIRMITSLNRTLRGWANYFRHGVSKRVFSLLDDQAWWRIVGWIRAKHSRIGMATAYDWPLFGEDGLRATRRSASAR